ncbi:MAG: polysaccharide pyruvyl transferase family protein [Ruminococcus bromii]|nr:polysaccharide pyruvyl transferase family protein [Ruminococcus bromii]MDD6433486.1 polysaccharide pyruvyl transferase family protein [Ruminococcus bromii]
MKKAGIVTFHQALSYGAKLQAYALQQFLQYNGIENDIIDYTCHYMYTRNIRPIRVGTQHKLKSFVRSLITMRQTGIDRRKSVAFRKQYMQLSRPFNAENISEAADEYSLFIAGSDQVWSPICVGFDPVYFLNFAKPEQKYSYAASIAVKELPADKKEAYKNLLTDFQEFSVREQSGANIIKNLLGRDAEINIDPTLLLTEEQWNEIAKPVINEPYIFLFNVRKSIKLIDYAKQLSKKTGLKIYYLQKERIHKVKGVTYLEPVMANEFVGLIKNAEYVCTNSFHGTAFSVIFKKKFAVEYQHIGGRNIRSEELLNQLGIKNHEITNDFYPNPDEKVDWDNVEKILSVERKKSQNYLEKIKENL